MYRGLEVACHYNNEIFTYVHCIVSKFEFRRFLVLYDLFDTLSGFHKETIKRIAYSHIIYSHNHVECIRDSWQLTVYVCTVTIYGGTVWCSLKFPVFNVHLVSIFVFCPLI